MTNEIQTSPLAEEIKAELTALNAPHSVTLTNDGQTAIIQLPAHDVFESRWILQAFNTRTFRAQRRDRQIDQIEVKYR